MIITEQAVMCCAQSHSRMLVGNCDAECPHNETFRLERGPTLCTSTPSKRMRTMEWTLVSCLWGVTLRLVCIECAAADWNTSRTSNWMGPESSCGSQIAFSRLSTAATDPRPTHCVWTQSNRRRELLEISDSNFMFGWCALDNGPAIYNSFSQDMLIYTLQV